MEMFIAKGTHYLDFEKSQIPNHELQGLPVFGVKKEKLLNYNTVWNRYIVGEKNKHKA